MRSLYFFLLSFFLFAGLVFLAPYEAYSEPLKSCGITRETDSEDFKKMMDEDQDNMKAGDIKVSDLKVTFRFRQDICPSGSLIVDWCDDNQDVMHDFKEGKYEDLSHQYAESGEYYIEIRAYCNSLLAARDSQIVLVK